jgi:hypothetical protein
MTPPADETRANRRALHGRLPPLRSVRRHNYDVLSTTGMRDFPR